MKIEQIYTSCLAQGAYYIESNGEVAIIDPLRETQQYVDKAKANNACASCMLIMFLIWYHIYIVVNLANLSQIKTHNI